MSKVQARHTHAHDFTDVPVDDGRAWLRVALWLSLCLLAVSILAGGHSNLYIAPNIRWTIWLALVASLAIATLDGYTAWQRGDRLRVQWPGEWHGCANIVRFAPLAIGVLVPPALLGAGSLAAHDAAIALVGAPHAADSAVATAPTTLNLLQLQGRGEAGSLVSGEMLQVTGFAYHQSGLPAGTWLLTRFVTPHCVAEAQPIALLVRGTGPPDNAWVTISGALSGANVNGHTVALLVDQRLVRIAIPLDPYLIY